MTAELQQLLLAVDALLASAAIPTKRKPANKDGASMVAVLPGCITNLRNARAAVQTQETPDNG